MKQVALAFCLLSTCVCSSQTTPIENHIDEIFSDLVDGLRPGSAVCVIQDDAILINKGYGYADLAQSIKISPNTVFDLASVSKQFCGFAIASLVIEGAIRLEDDVRNYIPELPQFGHTITIRHLVHHISGIRDWTSTLPLAGWSFDDVISFDQILRAAYRQQELNFAPGDEYSYSNTGYNLLAKVVERASGIPFARWMEMHVFEPMGMSQSSFLADHSTVVARRAHGYYRDNGVWHQKPNLLTALGSSSMYSTTTDLAKWLRHLAKPSPELKPVFDLMQSQGILNNREEIAYAFGLSIRDFRGTPRIGHSGSWASFRTYVCHFPEYDLSIIVLNNFPSNPTGYATEIASYFIPEVEDKPRAEEATSPELPQERLESLAGTYKLGPAWYVTLTVDQDQLWTQATGEDKFPMTALADSLFSIEAYGGRTMVFRQDERGRVDRLEYAGMICPRMKSDEHDQDGYSGKYYSEELETFYEVSGHGDSLSMTHFRLGTLQLVRAYGEDFAGEHWFNRSVNFDRDAKGSVTGMRVTSGRARNQWFRKVE